MCMTLKTLGQALLCSVQMLVRILMTILLMIENLIRMLLQTLYNFLSLILQVISLLPICLVFLITARLRCLMCCGGAPCPTNRGSFSECLMSAIALIIIFFIFRATGLLDKIFYGLGYSKAQALPETKFVADIGDVTEYFIVTQATPTLDEKNNNEYEYYEEDDPAALTQEELRQKLYNKTIESDLNNKTDDSPPVSVDKNTTTKEWWSPYGGDETTLIEGTPPEERNKTTLSEGSPADETDKTTPPGNDSKTTPAIPIGNKRANFSYLRIGDDEENEGDTKDVVPAMDSPHWTTIMYYF